MTWFTYKTSDATPVTRYAPVRREIIFQPITENLKEGDWITLSTVDLKLGKTYSFVNNQVVQAFDEDSYLVVYETASNKTATYSFIDSDSNLYFKSVSDVNSGSLPEGKYYIYYHADNIQYIEFNGYDYVRTTNPGGFNFIASTTGSSASTIDYYSTVVNGDSTNTRIATLGYFAPSGSWQNQETSEVGAKVFGSFNGPKLKIFGTKGPNAGKILVKIIKTSMTGIGQQLIKTETVDLFYSSTLNDSVIYSINIEDLNLFDQYEDLYGTFSFEIEILNEKNPASSSRSCKINKYGFIKNYNLSFSDEQIYENITFISTGVVR